MVEIKMANTFDTIGKIKKKEKLKWAVGEWG